MTNQAQGLFDDLLSIEVDITVVEDIDTAGAAGTMPDVTVQRAQVVAMYRDWLDDHLPTLDAAWASFASPAETAALEATLPADMRVLIQGGGLAPAGRPDAGRGALDADLARLSTDASIADAMCRIMASAGAVHDAADAAVIRRIRGYAQRLRTVSADDATHSVDDIRIVRAAWEIGTGRIVAQSVTQLDGDVIVRVDDAFLAADRDALRALHARAVASALTNWRVLLDFVVQMTTAATRSLAAIRPFATPPWTALRRWRTVRKDTAAASGTTFRELWSRAQLRRTWDAFTELRTKLLDEGGQTIESSRTTGDVETVYARTVIQPDGDSLWFVRADTVSHAELLNTHASDVAGWYERTGAAVATLQRYVTALGASLAAIVTGVVTLSTAVATSGITWLAIAVGGLTGVIGVAGLPKVVAWSIRRRLGALRF